ncbi:DUF6069 family protein [Marinitenerispora sediminis]|uniref:Uncharacterized protein n=1 Tax=Marinitenerispora sediminis TaxID=1931232 RepID=A0A368T2G3_9ACTN|nr:DUF6069 family protein [Marinitenerispora sediminis]RCV48086.1 hypothetical protein DEF28_24520 [Marinitenerispora sediminis]RCV51883.1 hypothetical protein DEF23_19640 [Marinitenerispora sediminis]RCV55663.1 hypothetical protein DEF24_17665 [Marinitenerispora sediminis]
MSVQPSTENAAPPSARPGSPWWRAGAVGVAAAVAANLLLLGAGHLLGASMTHPDPSGATVGVTAGGVALASALPLALGFAAAVALSLLWKGFLRTAQIVGTALALLSAVSPLLLDTDTPTRVVLALMHVVLAPAVWLSIAAVRRRALS